MIMQSPQDAQVYFDQQMEEAQFHELPVGYAAVFSRRSPEKEAPNEDAAAVIPYEKNSAMLIVADGMGGAVAGEQASRLAVLAMKKALLRGLKDQLPGRAAIMNGFEQANHAVCDLGMGAATTLTVVEVQDDCVRPYHVGDSMILVVGGRGKIKLQTTSHSPVGYGVEAGLINQEDAIHHEERHLVLNTIGSKDMRIEVGSSRKLALRDTVLVGSDGLFDNLRLDEIVERVRKGAIKNAVASLANDTSDRMLSPNRNEPSKPDDLTFVIFRRTSR